MQIHRSAHTRAFTVIANSALQDNQLSFVARGLLAYLLSRRDEEQVDVRRLAALCSTGRQQIAGALRELGERGYYVAERVQDPETGRWETRTAVYEIPQVTPEAGELAVGDSGAPPTGVNTEGKIPPSPAADADAGAEAGTEAKADADSDAEDEDGVDGSDANDGGDGDDGAELTPQDAALIRRIAAIDGRLRIGEVEAAPLVPLIARWRERGVADSVLARVLTAGLPSRVYVPVKLLASRLTRKLPPRPVAVQATSAREECPKCARPLRGGRCGPCTSPAAASDDRRRAEVARAEVARAGRARVRAALAVA